MDITQGIVADESVVKFDCFADGFSSLLRPLEGKAVSVTTHGWIGEAKGSLVSAAIEMDLKEKECPRGFVLRLEIKDDDDRGAGATAKFEFPGGRERGCCVAITNEDGSIHLSLNTGDVTITPL